MFGPTSFTDGEMAPPDSRGSEVLHTIGDMRLNGPPDAQIDILVNNAGESPHVGRGVTIATGDTHRESALLAHVAPRSLTPGIGSY